MKNDFINLFVYDSFVKGKVNNTLLGDSEYLGAVSLSSFDSFDMGSFISVLPGSGVIHGEVYRVSSKTLKQIDRYQGYGKLFKRNKTKAVLPSGEIIDVEIYTLMDQCFARNNRRL